MWRMLRLTVGAAVAIVLGGLVYLGALRNVDVVEEGAGPYPFAYREASSVSMAEVARITTELTTVLARAGVARPQPLDLYFPASARRPPQIGFLVSPDDSARLAAADSTVRFRTIPVQQSLVAVFPWHARVSFIIGYIRVSKALEHYRAAHRLRETETFTIDEGARIRYVQRMESEGA